MIKSNHTSTTNHHHHPNSALETLNDLDSEEAALHEFDFLTGDAANNALGLNEQKPSGSEHSNNEWEMDSNRIKRLKEEYKRDRQMKQVHTSATITNSNSAAIRHSLLNNGGTEEMTNDQRKTSLRPTIELPLFTVVSVDSMMFRNGKNFMGESPMESLGELVDVKLSNDNEGQYEVKALSPSP